MKEIALERWIAIVLGKPFDPLQVLDIEKCIVV